MIAWSSYEIGSYRIPCPNCGRGPRDRTLGVTIEPYGSGVAHCFRCEHVANYRPEDGARVVTSSKPSKTVSMRAKHETLSDYGRDLWAACRPLAGVALDYLTARACRIPPADGGIRWHPSLKHPTGYAGPALVALVTDAVTCQPLTLHRTWITATAKAHVDPPRLLLGGHRKAGGVVRLWPDEAVTIGLSIAEGIETALSLALGHAPVWACIDAGNLKALPVLAGIESLVIGADHDAAGQSAANACAQRWANAGRMVMVAGVEYGA
ncbi:toprim domain-containing protein [Paraburkholderia sp. EG304]|uniref:DUF7146 domain-containing protein n=1 Tax=Paraburkholderia sp. EG304 TaxID=3237015 RepID=UPI0039790529